jgi:hypothetical protein
LVVPPKHQTFPLEKQTASGSEDVVNQWEVTSQSALGATKLDPAAFTALMDMHVFGQNVVETIRQQKK